MQGSTPRPKSYECTSDENYGPSAPTLLHRARVKQSPKQKPRSATGLDFCSLCLSVHKVIGAFQTDTLFCTPNKIVALYIYRNMYNLAFS